MKFFVTTPIYYVNDIPHIGHAYTTIAADILARFKKIMGFKVFLLTGTDEHGRKVQKAAEEKGISPKELADEVHMRFKELWKVLSIDYTRFIRTTEEEHEKAVIEIWKRIEKKGDIYLGTYSGWYCVPCETFLPSSQLIDGKCPSCGRIVDKLEEPSFFFRASRYKEKLKRYIEESKSFVEPEFRGREVLSILADVQDISISRLHLTWGIPVPSNPEHAIYVWFDALINYLTGCGFPNQFYEDWWPVDVHIIGKDILKFHAVFWPMFLMSANIILPRKVFAHGWWQVAGHKMSKSLKNVVDPFEISQVFGADTLRYFMFKEVPFGYDGDFSEDAIRRRYENDLAKDLGNLVLRTFRMIERFTDGELSGEKDAEVKGVIEEVFPKWKDATENLRFSEALGELWKIVSTLNRYIDRKAPWSLHKQGDLEGVRKVLYSALEGLKAIFLMLSPYCPSTSRRVLECMNVKEFGDPQKFLMSERKYSSLKNPGILFPM